MIFIQIISTHAVRHCEFSKFPGGEKRRIPKASGATPHPHYGPDEYLLARRVVDGNVVRCLGSSREF